jgi:transcription elongation factor Elf1
MEKIHPFKLLQQFYPDVKTTAERIKKYRNEHYSDDPLKILKRKPDGPRPYEMEVQEEQGPKVEKVQVRQFGPSEDWHYQPGSVELGVDPETGDQIVTVEKYNLFRDVFPKLDCPKCGHKKSMQLRPLCGGCKEAQGGKFKTAWRCLKCKHEEVSEKAVGQWWKEMSGGKEFHAYLPDGHGFIPKIYLDDERKAGD